MFVLFVFCLFIVVRVESQSACDKVSFIDRAGWNASEPTSITNLTGKPLSFYVVHHSHSPPSCYDDVTCAESVRSIQRFHQQDRGWADIGYHFLVGENGKVYEGRGWDRQGAHSPGWNNDAFGICIIGDFSRATPNDKALQVVQNWIRCGIERGHVTPVHYIITHRQSQRPGYTECPGDGAFNQVKTWSRFCPFQNDGANLTTNETLANIARDICQRDLVPTSTNNRAGTSFSSFLSLFSLFHFFSHL